MLDFFGRPDVRRGILATAIGATLASVAHAADESPQVMKKVVVGGEAESYQRETSSSAKYTQPLVETPQTVVVIPPEVISQRNATTLRDVLRNTPRITFQAGEGGGGLPGDQNFSMRGFTSRNSVFVDGIRDAEATRGMRSSGQRRSCKRPDRHDWWTKLEQRCDQSDQQDTAPREQHRRHARRGSGWLPTRHC